MYTKLPDNAIDFIDPLVCIILRFRKFWIDEFQNSKLNKTKRTEPAESCKVS
jgi:hypothetical protein